MATRQAKKPTPKAKAKPKARPKARAKAKPVRGRPTKYRVALCKKATDFMALGYSKAETAAHLGITRETLYQWEKTRPDFSYAIKEGEELSALWWATKGMEGMMGKIPYFNAAVWIFNMKNRHGWKDKQEITGNDNAPLFANFAKAVEVNQSDK